MNRHPACRHDCIFLVCQGCAAIQHLDDDRLAHAMRNRATDAGFRPTRAVLEILGRFTEDLQALSRAIRWGEADKLFDLFTRTREIRRGIIAAGQESAEPNFGRDRGKH